MFKLVQKIKISLNHKSHKYRLDKYRIVGFPYYYFSKARTSAHEKKIAINSQTVRQI